MKKYFMTLAAALCCAMTTTVFTACGSDDDSPKDSAKLISAEWTYEASVEGTLFELCDVSVTYKDENGQEKTEPVTGTTWSKTFTVKNFPFNSSIKLNATRNNVAATAESYDYVVKYYLAKVTAIYSNGQKKNVEKLGNYLRKAGNCKAAKVDDNIESLNSWNLKYILTVEDNELKCTSELE